MTGIHCNNSQNNSKATGHMNRAKRLLRPKLTEDIADYPNPDTCSISLACTFRVRGKVTMQQLHLWQRPATNCFSVNPCPPLLCLPQPAMPVCARHLKSYVSLRTRSQQDVVTDKQPSSWALLCCTFMALVF